MVGRPSPNGQPKLGRFEQLEESLLATVSKEDPLAPMQLLPRVLVIPDGQPGHNPGGLVVHRAENRKLTPPFGRFRFCLPRQLGPLVRHQLADETCFLIGDAIRDVKLLHQP